MKFSWYRLFISLAFLFVILFISQLYVKEAFGATQPGTLIQLAAGHVPTEEDIREAREWKNQVKRDLIGLTGSY